MGHRFEIYTDEESARGIIGVAGKYKVEGRIVGRCEEFSETRLTILGDQGKFIYKG
jgi:hypothetical protein